MTLLARALALLLALAAGLAPADARMLFDQGGTATLRALSPGQRPRLTLPYDPVLVIEGDSQARGTPTAAEIAAYGASYVPTAQVQVLNAAGAFDTYNPAGSRAGLDAYSGNSPNPGAEIGFIRRFIARYTNTLYILKRGAPGSYQTRGPSNGSVTGTISGDNLTVTSGTAGNNYLLVGGSLPTGIYLPFVNSGSVWYARKLGTTATPGLGSLASATYATYVTTNSWSVTEGSLYLGANNSLTNQTRGLFAAALSGLTAAGRSPRIVALLPILGTNDMGDATAGGNFQADAGALITRQTSDIDLSNARIVLLRVGTGSLASTTVRAAQAALVAADPTRRALIDMDGQIRHDGTHWNLAGLDYAGSTAFDLAFPQ